MIANRFWHESTLSNSFSSSTLYQIAQATNNWLIDRKS